MATTSKRKPTAAAKKTTIKPAVKSAINPELKAPVKAAAKAPMQAPVKAPIKPVAKIATAPVATPTSPPGVEPHVLRKKELIERVVSRSGVKKKDAKPTIEAMLAVLGEALSKGEELNLHPLGKVMVNRVIEKPNAEVLITKVRRKTADSGSTVVKITPNS